MKKIFTIFSSTFLLIASTNGVFAQSTVKPSASPAAVSITVDSDSISESQKSTASAESTELEAIKKEDITKPEETQEKSEILNLFERRPISSLSVLNFIGFTIQYAVSVGVPANTIVLILLLPFLATMVAFVRLVIGLPSLDILVPIALSITLVSTGILAGSILLFTILLASTVGRLILKKIRIMQLPKKALSILLISVFVFAALVISAANGILIAKQLSIFPILLLILLGEQIISVQLARSLKETFTITLVTILLGVIGFFILSTEIFRQRTLLYPEIILILLPANFIIGRYFGLRLTEIYRFSKIKKHGNK